MNLIQRIKSWFSKPKPQPVPSALQTFVGDATWPWYVVIDGHDAKILPRKGRKLSASWFGGNDDPLDNGETASGILTKGNPNLLGCALPMRLSNGKVVKSCAGSPIKSIKWRSVVLVRKGDKTLSIPLIDVGPAKYAGDAIDLTQAAFRQFAQKKDGVTLIDEITIVGGAKMFGAFV